jgi:hypothetical protein
MDDKTKGRRSNDEASRTDTGPEERANLGEANLGQKEANLEGRSEAKLGRMSKGKAGVTKPSKKE